MINIITLLKKTVKSLIVSKLFRKFTFLIKVINFINKTLITEY